MKTTISTKQGWTKRGIEYVHNTGVIVKKEGRVWGVIGSPNDGLHYQTMWAAMSAAANTKSIFI